MKREFCLVRELSDAHTTRCLVLLFHASSPEFPSECEGVMSAFCPHAVPTWAQDVPRTSWAARPDTAPRSYRPSSPSGASVPCNTQERQRVRVCYTHTHVPTDMGSCSKSHNGVCPALHTHTHTQTHTHPDKHAHIHFKDARTQTCFSAHIRYFSHVTRLHKLLHSCMPLSQPQHIRATCCWATIKTHV